MSWLEILWLLASYSVSFSLWVFLLIFKDSKLTFRIARNDLLFTLYFSLFLRVNDLFCMMWRLMH